MTTRPVTPVSVNPRRRPDVPYHVYHDSFDMDSAEALYGPADAEADDFEGSHLPDEVTRDLARRMHYAAWRAATAAGEKGRKRWLGNYLQFRDRIVVGNRKLVYRAVQRWSPPASVAEDMAGECQVVLIQAVGAYNPFLGVRFSTYAFTCLMRALARLSHRHANDRLARRQALEGLDDCALAEVDGEDAARRAASAAVDLYLREGHGLLSPREKRVLVRRFRLDGGPGGGTLEQVGREVGLSKERVRQVQACALDKLRKALITPGRA